MEQNQQTVNQSDLNRLSIDIEHIHQLAEKLLPSSTTIQPFICGNNQAALDAAARLRDFGLYVPAIRPPTVPVGQARLRITLTAAHSRADIERLAEGLHNAV